MEFETRQFITQSEANRSDKLKCVKHQRIISILIALCALINCVLIFIIYGNAPSLLTLGYGINNALIFITCLLTVYWCQQSDTYLQETEDDWGEETDNFSGRIIFYLSILTGVANFVFLILYLMGRQFMFALYKAADIASDDDKFQKMLAYTVPFIAGLTVLIIVGLVYTLYSLYQLTISQSTSRFNIYLLALTVSLATWISLYIVSKHTTYSIPIILYCILLVVILIAVIANAWRFRGIFLILASIQVLLLPALITYQAQYIRDFQEIQKADINDCQETMNKYPESYLDSHGCYAKYLKTTTKVGCPNNQASCQVYSTDCPKNQMTQRWEFDVEGDKTQHPLGCLNLDCCGLASNVKTWQLFVLIGLTLASSIMLFGIILFEFHLSKKARGDKTLGRNVEILFLVLFLGSIIFGILLLTLHKSDVPVREQAEFAQVKIERASEFATIKSTLCSSLEELVGTQVRLSGDCKVEKTCPLNKLESTKKQSALLFGIWVKGIHAFVKPEATIYQTLSTAKFLWPDYDGTGSDFFAIIGSVSELQEYVDSIKICYQVNQADLGVHLYQNVVEISTESAILNNHQGIFHKADAKPPAAKPAAAKCAVPNCADCQQDKCNKCSDGFRQDPDLGCKYSGELSQSDLVIVNLFEQSTTKASGHVVGVFKHPDNNLITTLPLGNAKVCWEQEDITPTCTQTQATGAFEMNIPIYDVADYSLQLYQPDVGMLTVSLEGFQSLVRHQVLQFQDQLNMGTIQLIGNAIIIPPKPTTDKPKSQHKHKHNAEAAKPAADTKAPTCKNTEFLDGQNKCQETLCKDVPNCLFCDKNNKCQQCAQDYTLSKELKCETSNKCSKPYSQNNCLKCDIKTPTKCDEDGCDLLSTFAAGECKKNLKLCTTKVENCALCGQDNKCGLCQQGYKLESGTCKIGDFNAVFATQYYSTKIYVYDAVDKSTVSDASIDLHAGTCGQSADYGKGHSNSDGFHQFDKLLKGTIYNVVVKHTKYTSNCYQFIDSDIVNVPISMLLRKGQARMVLEWQTDSDLDLLLSFNPTDSMNCLVGYLNKRCSGAVAGKASTSILPFESITIEQMANTQYLIFVQNFADDDATELAESNALLKYYVYDRDAPAVTYIVPNDYVTPQLGTDVAVTNTEWVAWLVSCLDGSQSEIPYSLISQNGVWWTTSLSRWYPSIPIKGAENFPSPRICKVAL